MVQLMTSYVLFAVIRHARDIGAFERAQRRGEWHYIHPRPLASFRVGVLGLGELGGSAAAELARAGFDVRGWARSPKAIPGVRCAAGPMLDGFLAETDILVVMLPLTPQTRGLLDARRLGLLPRGASLVNVSRGAIIDEAGADRGPARGRNRRSDARRIHGRAVAGGPSASGAWTRC